ncbi:MAG TPA: restriction endonuclease [Streptomyces sp.]|nr:restriction endonuclease [Streptomyces sp.]
MAALPRRTRTAHRERAFDLRATAVFFALVAVLVCLVGWLGRAALHVVERRPAWALVLLLSVPAVAVAYRRGNRRFSAARLARRTGAALEEATTTALDALETEHADSAPARAAGADAAAGPAGAREVPAGVPADAPGTALPRGEAGRTAVVADGGAGTAPLPGDDGATTAAVPGGAAGAAGEPPVLDYGDLSPEDFEQAIAGLCARDGCRRVEVVGGAGDLGADVLATTPDGRRVVIQCKRYADDHKVGSQDLQRFGGTCFSVHEADVAVIVTTSDFTVPATEYAEQCGIVCVGGRELRGWSDGSMTAPWTCADGMGAGL